MTPELGARMTKGAGTLAEKMASRLIGLAAVAILSAAVTLAPLMAFADAPLYFDGAKGVFTDGSDVLKSDSDALKAIINGKGASAAHNGAAASSPPSLSLSSLNAAANSRNSLLLGMSTIINPDIWHTETDVLYRHISEVEYGGERSAWGQAFGSRQDMDTGLGLSVSQKHWGVVIGMDNPFDVSCDRLATGFMLGYGKADRDFDIGDSSTKSFFASVYAKYDLGSGAYIAGNLKYNRYDSEFDVKGVDSGSVKQDGYGGSVEAGKKMDIKDGWYWTPSLRYSYMRIQNADFMTKNGISVFINDFSSKRLRGAVCFGRGFTLKDGSRLDAWASVAVLHEFDGKKAYVDGALVTPDYSGTWGAYSIGLDWRMRETMSLSAFYEYVKGDNIEQPWSLGLGLNLKM